MTRQRSYLVVLHWGMAVLIAVMLLSGGLAPTRMHVIGGLLTAVLLALRIGVRLTSDRQPPVERGWQARAATMMHLALYALMTITVLSGIAIAVDADLWVAFANEPPRADFAETALYSAHAALTKALMVAVVGHVGVALWHHFVLKDHILSRMWFRKAAQKQF